MKFYRRQIELLVIRLIKLMMNAKNKKIKLGVLNMTICFDRSPAKCTIQNIPQNSPPKTQQFPTFIPRYSSKRHRTSVSKGDPRMSPYLTYRNSQNESIRYFREQQQNLRSSFQRIAGFSPINNKIQLEINEKVLEEEHTYTPNNFTHDTHLKMVYNKKHLRNTIELQQERIKTHERLIFNFKSNPEESLKTIFTVRPAKTSQRTRQKVKEVVHQKCDKPKKIRSIPLTHRQCRSRVPNIQSEIKRIRPWSTSKNWETKLSMYQSDILENNEAIKNQLS